jgi:hypothetical protein
VFFRGWDGASNEDDDRRRGMLTTSTLANDTRALAHSRTTSALTPANDTRALKIRRTTTSTAVPLETTTVLGLGDRPCHR